MTVHPSVLIIGPFPPPLGGAAKITNAVFEALVTAGVSVHRIDTSASNLGHHKSLRHHVERVAGTIAGSRALVAQARRCRTLYLVPDAGRGGWYTLLYATLASICYRHIFLHHHSSRYVGREVGTMRMVTRLTRSKAVHILLTEGMAEQFQKRYGPLRTRVVGNAQFSDVPARRTPRESGRLRVGHLSNLCAEKGFFRVAAAFERLRSAGIDAELHLAGPVLDLAVRERISTLQDTHGSTAVVDHGPLQGPAKAEFYELVDLFLLPTNFDQEGAPLVIYEAAAGGAPTLSVDRACIPEIIAALGGAACRRDDDFGQFVVTWLESQPGNPPGDPEHLVRERFAAEHRLAEQQFTALLQELTSGRPREPARRC